MDHFCFSISCPNYEGTFCSGWPRKFPRSTFKRTILGPSLGIRFYRFLVPCDSVKHLIVLHISDSFIYLIWSDSVSERSQKAMVIDLVFGIKFRCLSFSRRFMEVSDMPEPFVLVNESDIYRRVGYTKESHWKRNLYNRVSEEWQYKIAVYNFVETKKP